jgi:LysM repeat protein
MKLKILSLLLITGLMFNVGCTSSNDEATDTEAADSQLEGETGASPDAAVEGAEAGTEEVAEGADDFASDEEVVADTGDEQAPAEGVAEESAKPTGDVAADDSLPADSLEDGSKIVAEDGTGTESSELAEGSSSAQEEGVFDNASSAAPDAAASSYVSEDAPKSIPVKKIADAPYKKNGVLLNTVYLARAGDDLGSISQKIGVSKDQILQGNPNLSRSVKVGDKVYYNSPKRPDDSQKMLTYYEDSGVPAQSFVAKSGDNIRAISKNLLGDSNSWKEVWATNLAVDSKGELAEGTELRYWPEGSVAAAAPAPAEPEVAPAPDAPQMPEPAAPPVAANEQAAPAAPSGQDDFALPDDMANGNAAAVAGTVANEPPPPPPPPAAAPQKSVASSDEKDLTFMLSAGGLLLVGVGVLLGIIRKGRARKMSMNTHTQI